MTESCAQREGTAESVRLNVVHVREVDAHQECEPMDWKLITTEPIHTLEQVERVVDGYRGRWVIEEYFKKP